MKLIVMGTGPFAVPSFRTLLASEHEILCLITRPDKVARGRKLAPPSPMRQAAEAEGLPVFAPESINSAEALDLLEQRRADLFIVCDYGQILSAAALEKARCGGINLHGSLLPKYRGAAPINWALLHGETVTGVTVIHMTPRLDGGPMLVRRSLEVGGNEDAVQLEERLSHLGVDAVIKAIAMLANWDGESLLGEVQNKELVTKAPRLKKSDGEIDWDQSAEQIFNQVRALKPWPGTFTNLLQDGKPPMRVIFHQVRANVVELEVRTVGSGKAGEGDTMSVQCGAGVLTIDRIQPAGKREMTSAEFMRGHGSEFQFGPVS